MKHQAINLVKFKALSQRLKLPLYRTVGLLDSLWIFCQIQARDGDLTKFTALEIAGWLEWDGDVGEQSLIDALVETHWLDRDIDGLRVHDWDSHKPNWLKGVDASPRTKKRPPSGTPSESPSESPGVPPSATPPNLPQPNLTNSPPTPPVLEEGELCEMLRGRGVKYPERAVSMAQNNGCNDNHILAAVQHFDAHPGAWDGGALYERVRTLHPNQDPTDLWPLESDGYRNQQSRNRREKELKDAQSKREATKAELDAQRAREQEREATWAPVVDALSRKEAEDMLRREIPEMAPSLLRNWKRGKPPDGLVRTELISILEQEGSVNV